MRRMNLSMLVCVLATVLITPLLTAQMTEAAPALTCPGWNFIASPNHPASSNFLRGVATISANDVWAVGDFFDSSSFKDQTLIEHWNGSTWSIVTSPNPGLNNNDLFGVAAVSTNDVWAVGAFDTNSGSQTLIEHWNGSTWSAVSSPNPGSNNVLTGVAAVSANNIWAVGNTIPSPRSHIKTLIERWNGSSWNLVTSPNIGSRDNSLSSAAVVSANDVWAVGESFLNGSLTHQTLIEHWNGSTWSIVSSPNTGSDDFLSSVAAVSANDIWAVGDSNNSSQITQTLVEHWNGSTWSVVSSPNPGSSFNALSGVAAVSTNDVWAVGEWGTTTHPDRALIEHWNGTSWSVVRGATLGRGMKFLDGVARILGTSQLWAVGTFAPLHQADQTLTEFHC